MFPMIASFYEVWSTDSIFSFTSFLGESIYQYTPATVDALLAYRAQGGLLMSSDEAHTLTNGTHLR